ncbi:MAG: class I SAM-dependent methyltransferase [Candidatus Eisenbacteria bacterium]
MTHDRSWSENYARSTHLDVRLDAWKRFGIVQGPFGVDLIPEEPPQPGRILDAGCGTGENLCRLRAAYPDADLFGLDLSEAMVTTASARCPDADCRIGNVEALPWPNGHFGGLVCTHVLYHVENIAAALAEFGRVLSQDGWAVISTVCRATGYEARELFNRACASAGAPEFTKSHSPGDVFNVENGEALIRDVFPRVELHSRTAELRFGRAEDALAYIMSMDYAQRAAEAAPDVAARLRHELERHIQDAGSFVIRKDSGTWLCRPG